MEFELSAMGGEGRYKLLTGLVVPRPIAFVSSMAEDGSLNAAPFSFFNVFGASPPVIVLGINRRAGRAKDSFRNITTLGEFVVNICVAAIAEKLNAASGDYAAHVSEFEKAGLTPEPSRKVRPPRIAESPANLECRLMQTVSTGPSAELIIGEVLLVHVRDDLLNGTKVDPAKLDAIGRMGGPVYAYTRELFTLQRPIITGPEAA